jgi:hypothetical protein
MEHCEQNGKGGFELAGHLQNQKDLEIPSQVTKALQTNLKDIPNIFKLAGMRTTMN